MRQASLPTRAPVHACIHPQTFKYFFHRDTVTELWRRLAERYGTLKMNGAFRMMEIEGEHFFLRSVIGGNPITVIRTRHCTRADVDELHRLIGFVDGDEG